MKLDIEKFRKGEFAIHVRTQEEYDLLMELLQTEDFVWTSGDLPTEKNLWIRHKEDTVIDNDTKLVTDNIGLYNMFYDKDIVKFSDFIGGEEDMKRFKVGQSVKIKKKLREGWGYDVFVNDEMEELAGKTLVIEGINDCGHYKLEGQIWCWSEDRFEVDTVEKNSTFTKDDLQEGDILVDGDNDVSIIKDGETSGGTVDLDCLDKLLEYKGRNRDYDIVRVIRPNVDNIVFERNELIVEYTTRELERKLGHKIRIKDEN